MPDRPTVAVSTWVLHDLLGRPNLTRPADGDAASVAAEPPRLTHHEAFRQLREIGIDRVELCHFHLTDLSPAGLTDVRDALVETGVGLSSLLIDTGDVTGAADPDGELGWIERWIDRAAALGAACCRVSAGHAPPTADSAARAADAFGRLADHAAARGVRLATENWHAFADTPQSVLGLLDALGGRLGLCLDFKNWDGRLEDLSLLAPWATSCHVPVLADADGEPLNPFADAALAVVHGHGFDGTYTLVSSTDPQDPWPSLGASAERVRAVTDRA